MVKKSLHNRIYFDEILNRVSMLTENSPGKWGKMNVAQMLKHCDLILGIALGKTWLSTINPLFETIGVLTKIEMQVFNNGIPRNMPTFRKLIVNFECDFTEARKGLLETMNEYWECYTQDNLPEKHVLFGKMGEKDWGFLEYKHLDHHLKQFNV
ncbi:DUF1569 domain-containing protein [Chryseobacterium sp. B21-037]|uniref:DUF1569 domain-containing protein n=1 Tax=unclassified Chryseobacterium TaxID=2593645 RepID=UPI001E31B7E5|nr:MULTISPECIES: DUF1569 domain-containing protein [unclassified Chryseobacterium]MDC8103872.1 DUF1569 domain-containing protein [Chryseobacterium sp. B21-037]